MQLLRFDFNLRPLIVAEIGNNHEGRLEVARELVRRAADCGVDAVKFQTFRTDQFVRSTDEERFKRMSSFELSRADFEDLRSLAASLGLLFFSTPLDLPSVEVLEPLVDCFKIASGDITFYPLLESVARTGKPVILSSGASDLSEVRHALAHIGNDNVAILHCVSSYPAPFEQVNLSAIRTLKEAFGFTVGYSDHTLGIDACIAAVGLGAQIIEKHFTLDKKYSSFRDHQLSADPREMKDLVERLHRVASMLGSPQKAVQPCEQDIVRAIRRSIVAAGDLSAGTRLTIADFTWLRPADGLPPGSEHTLVGRTLKRNISKGHPILSVDVE